MLFRNIRILVPLAPFKYSAARLWPDASPLLEKECNFICFASISNFENPGFLNGSGTRPAFTADNDPINPLQIHLPNRTDEGLKRYELNTRRRRLEVIQTHRVFGVLDRDAEPNVLRSTAALVSLAQITGHKRTSLGENLIGVPRRLLHRVKHRVDERRRHLFVKEVAHRIHENAPRLLPPQRLLQALRSKCQIEAIFEWMTFDATEPFGKPFSVTEITAGSDFGTAGHGVPSGICPFYLCRISHVAA
jgi:hypothetical protein